MRRLCSHDDFPSIFRTARISSLTQAARSRLLGFGTVGSAVARLLYARGEEHSLQLTHVCNRNVARKKADWIPPDVMWTEDMEDVLASDVDVVVELMGGLDPAHDWVRRALQSGKSVVTANKQLIAHFGSELLQVACGPRTVAELRSVRGRWRSGALGICATDSRATA